VLDVDPHFLPAHYVLIFSLVEKGLFGEALADIEKWRGADDTRWSLMLEAHVYGRSGQHVLARRALAQLERLHRQPMDPAPVLLAQVGLGDAEEAFAWFDEAYATRSTALSSLKVNPIYDRMRGDPRFQGLMRRIGVTP
jgi:serine/threonine-protein kinase